MRVSPPRSLESSTCCPAQLPFPATHRHKYTHTYTHVHNACTHNHICTHIHKHTDIHTCTQYIHRHTNMHAHVHTHTDRSLHCHHCLPHPHLSHTPVPGIPSAHLTETPHRSGGIYDRLADEKAEATVRTDAQGWPVLCRFRLQDTGSKRWVTDSLKE